MADANQKRCSICKEVKVLSDFPSQPKKRLGVHARCKKCHNAKVKQWKKDHPESAALSERKQGLKKGFGITLAQYETLLREHEHVCAICRQAPDCRALSVDHDHSTLKIRGLLCRRCNTGIGQFRDSIELLSNAIAYLEKSRR